MRGRSEVGWVRAVVQTESVDKNEKTKDENTKHAIKLGYPLRSATRLRMRSKKWPDESSRGYSRGWNDWNGWLT